MEPENDFAIDNNEQFLSCERALVAVFDQDSELLTFKVYDPLKKRWEDLDVEIPQSLEMRNICNMESWGGKIFMVNRGLDPEKLFIYDHKQEGGIREIDLRGITGFATCRVGDRLYFFGGWSRSKGYENTIRYFDMKSETWHQEGTTKRNLELAQAVQMEGFVYIIGGKLTVRDLNKELHKYDIQHKSWTSWNAMQTKRVFHDVCCLNNKVYVAGGMDESGQLLRSVEVYDPETNGWQLIAEMNRGRHTFKLIPIMNRLWAIGGFGEHAYNNIEIYDPESDKWSFEPEIPEHMVLCGGCVINGNIFDASN